MKFLSIYVHFLSFKHLIVQGVVCQRWHIHKIHVWICVEVVIKEVGIVSTGAHNVLLSKLKFQENLSKVAKDGRYLYMQEREEGKIC